MPHLQVGEVLRAQDDDRERLAGRAHAAVARDHHELAVRDLDHGAVVTFQLENDLLRALCHVQGFDGLAGDVGMHLGGQTGNLGQVREYLAQRLAGVVLCRGCLQQRALTGRGALQGDGLGLARAECEHDFIELERAHVGHASVEVRSAVGWRGREGATLGVAVDREHELRVLAAVTYGVGDAVFVQDVGHRLKAGVGAHARHYTAL